MPFLECQASQHLVMRPSVGTLAQSYFTTCCRERPPDGAVESCSSPSLTHRFVFPTALEVYCERIRPQHLANCSLRLHYTLDDK
ncbi:UNVERIFIED_CONTAM: hypothetical protein FKN15_054290 [Acipenser sinensis]